MLGELFSKVVNAATTPAKKAIGSGTQALNIVLSLPAELENFATEFRLAQQQAEQQLQQILNEVDSSFDRDVEDMTAEEREAATFAELAKAEQFLSQALFSVLKIVRLTIAEPSRVIEHDNATRGQQKKLRRL